jgi:alpha-glucosidase
MDRIPLYARAGAVIPCWTQAPPSTAGYHPTEVELHLFVPTEDSEHSSFLQEDDGLTFAALEGARYRTTFTVTRRGSDVTVRGDVVGDGYPEFRRTDFHLVVHGAAPSTVDLDGRTVPADGGRFVLANAGQDLVVRFQV